MQNGFTLIELLLVVVIIGIVAAFVLPKFGDVKEKAYVSAMKNDLRNLATDQEIYFEENGTYRTDLSGVPTSEDVTLEYARSGDPTTDGYVAGASHTGTGIVCALNRSTTDSPTLDGGVADYSALSPQQGQLVCG